MVLIILFFSTLLHSEPLLKPKNLENQKPKPQIQVPSPKKPTKSPQLDALSLNILAITPLIKENFYEKRFSTYGSRFFFSIPLTSLGAESHLLIETGLQLTYSRLNVLQPSFSFTRLYFSVPAYLKAAFIIGERVNLDLFGGLSFKLFQYDSRDTADGGFHTVTSGDIFQPDIGLGANYFITPKLQARVSVGYLMIGLGIEWAL